ncbi:hypothetical protein GCM10028805_22710 [Spirosoma harenae]
MLGSVTSCQSVPDLNAARRDLVHQLYKRGITMEEFDVAYEHLVLHSYQLGLRYHVEYRSYGPVKIEGLRSFLNDIKYARFLKQFNQAYEQLSNGLTQGLMGQAQYDMCYHLLLAQADFQGYTWNKFQNRFIES